jgi:hypothetical protein
MSAAAGLTILAGFLLYWHDSTGFTSSWMQSGAGIGFGIGAVFAIVGFVFGIMVGQTTKAMAQLGSQFQGKPSDEQLANMRDLQKKQGLYSKTTSILLILALIFMSIARYFVF